MSYITFIVMSALTVFFSIKLAKFGDVIERKANLSALLLGLLVGGATSLPEVTSSVTSLVLGEPNLALGNAFGSNVFNLLILAVLDVLFIKQYLFRSVTRAQRNTAWLVIMLSVAHMISIYFRISSGFLGLSVASIVMIVGYIVALRFFDMEEESSDEPATEEVEQDGVSLKRATIGFILCGALIMVFGSLLTISVENIAVETGLGASFAGTIFLAAATSLPEAVSGFQALKLRNVNLVVAGIFGSNLFNLLIVIGTDFLYQGPSIYAKASMSHNVSIFFSIVMIAIALIATLRKNTDKISPVRYAIPSILMIVTYFASAYLMYIFK
ncbi:MAG: sodium:calcium antiporter [Bacilli bacterium]